MNNAYVRAKRLVLSVREVADYLGLSVPSVYRAVSHGELPGEKIGGKWIIPRRPFFERFGHAGKRRLRPADRRSPQTPDRLESQANPSAGELKENPPGADRARAAYNASARRPVQRKAMGRFTGAVGYLTAAEVAQQLGCRDRYVREVLCEGTPPPIQHIKRGSIYAFRQEWIDEYNRSVTRGTRRDDNSPDAR
jgi:excisionase family DNA binding protein